MSVAGRVIDLINEGGRVLARRVLPQVLPATEMIGGGIQKAGRQLAVDTGLMRYLDAFPSVVSQGNIQGLLGTLDVPSKTPGRAPKPAWGNAPTPPAGSRPVNTLLPQSPQGPRTRGGALVAPEAAAEATRFPRVSQTAPVAEMPPMRASAPAPKPQVAEELGGRLDLRQGRGAKALTKFTTSTGAVRPEGTPLGGQVYSGKPFATERNIETIASGGIRAVEEPRAVNIGELGRSMFLDQSDVDRLWGEIQIDPSVLQRMPPDLAERFVQMGAQQTPKMSPGVRAAFGLDAGPAPMDAVADRAFAIAQGLRNAGAGAQTMDLSGLLDPRVMAALGGVAAAGGLGAGLMMSKPGEEGSAPVGEVPTTGKAPGTSNRPFTSEDFKVLFREVTGAPLGAFRPNDEVVYSSPNTIVTTGNEQQESAVREALAQADPTAAALARMVAPMSPEKYSSPAEYFAAREAFARQPQTREALAAYAASTGRDAVMQENLAAWGRANPALAYELQRRSLANPAANQQSPESVTTSTIDAAMGSDNAANAVGNAQAIGAAAVAPNQGNTDLTAVTSPQEKPYLRRTQDLIRETAQNIGMYSRY